MAASLIGQRIPHLEGREKVTGSALFAGNVKLPGMLWGCCLRSPVPYARLKRIDASRARQLPGVAAVITGQDIPYTLVGRRLQDLPILARDVVRFIGERVAAVAAEDRELAEQALELIEVEYDEMEPLLDPLKSMTPQAPVLHPDVQGYVNLPEAVTPSMKNVHSYQMWTVGDLEAGFVQADEIVEGVYTTAMTHQAYIEPNAATVSIDGEGRIHVWASQKQPYGIKDLLAQALRMDPSQVVMEYCRLGGEFGGKGSQMDIPLCYHLAKQAGRPVHMAMTYAEEFAAGNPRHALHVSFKTGVKRDGTLIAHQAGVVFDGGAYGAFKPAAGVALNGSAKAGGVYRIPNCRVEAHIVYTNHVPCGFMRAPGEPQVNFAIESHMDVVARHLGLDPLEFRRHNVPREGDASPIGLRWKDIRAAEVLEAAVADSNYGQPKPRPTIGRGIAIADRHIGGGASEALLRVTETGAVELVSGTPDAGTGAHTMLRQVIAETLTLPLERVTVCVANTDTAPFDGGLRASSTTHLTGSAVVLAANDAIRALKGWVAEIRGWRESDVELADGLFSSSSEPGEPVPFELATAAAVKRKGAALEFHARYEREHVPWQCFAAQVAEVEVDPETGRVAVLRISSAHDSGRLINPLAAEGQIEGAFAQGLGFATIEELLVDDGKVVNPSFADYKIPTMPDLPELRITFLEDAPGPAPFGGRAVGEHSLLTTAAAIANAIDDAVGVRLTSTPLTAEKVYRGLATQRAVLEG